VELFIALWQYGKCEVFADRRRSYSNLIKISRGARTGDWMENTRRNSTNVWLSSWE
jgi:hypothetical protein